MNGGVKMDGTVTVALAGNPNSGKTTIFNALTGARQHVGNYPGVTVDKVEGWSNVNGRRLAIVDLPGIYSLTAHSEEELVARNYLLDSAPQVVVDILDASNLERNLYLAVQLLELGIRPVLVLNMHDVAQRSGMVVDTAKLSGLLGVPVVKTIGHKKEGLDGLKEAIVGAATDTVPREPVRVFYGRDIEACLTELGEGLGQDAAFASRTRWFALKLLENDAQVIAAVRRVLGPEHALWDQVHKCRERLVGLYGDAPEILIADRRYGFISGLATETMTVGVEYRHDVSDHIDAVLTHPVLGLPIFLGLMYLAFWATFTLAEWPMKGLEAGMAWLGGSVAGLWPAGVDSPIKSLLVDGIIGGVGGVIVFLPNIVFLFLMISLLEDTGYMARAAFIMDRFMHKIGLHGKSFIPMVIGFGCSVPAIMATRILENRRDRLTTMMIIPLMSCGGRLPIYSLLIPAFFVERWQAPMLWLIYLIGVVSAVVVARVLRHTILRGESAGLVIELPPYRIPTVRGVVTHMWQRAWMYLRKAGTLILAISVILWALSSFPKPSPSRLAEYPDAEARQSAELRYSVVGRIGQFIEPAMRPLGFDWRISTALIGSVAAKEVLVAQMGIVLSIGEGEAESHVLREKLRDNYSSLTAFCLMLFCLMSAPCLATVAIMRKESGSWGWAGLQFAGLTAMAYMVTLVVYQVGSRLGAG